MKTTTVIEWSLEELDEANDIVDNQYADRLEELPARLDKTPKYDLCLVRSVWCKVRGLLRRDYAYVDPYSGSLPDFFEDTDYPVPSRYALELEELVTYNLIDLPSYEGRTS